MEHCMVPSCSRRLWVYLGVSSVIFGTESVSKYFRQSQRPKCKTDNGICRVQRTANPAIMAIQEQETSSSIPWLSVDDTTSFRASPERTFYCSCKSSFLRPIFGTDFFGRRLGLHLGVQLSTSNYPLTPLIPPPQGKASPKYYTPLLPSCSRRGR